PGEVVRGPLRLSLSAVFFFSSRRRHTRFSRDWSSDVCSSDLVNRLDALVGWWNAQSLARQFLLAGGLVSAAGAVVVAAFVTVLRSEERRVGRGWRRERAAVGAGEECT